MLKRYAYAFGYRVRNACWSIGSRRGRLAFVNPSATLAPNVTYTVTVDGAMARDGVEMAKTGFNFTTGSSGAGLGLTTPGASTAANGEFNSSGV